MLAFLNEVTRKQQMTSAPGRCLGSLLLLLALTVYANAQGGPEPSVEECDLLAAHPNDPQRMAEGTPDDRIVPRLAIRMCEEAAKAAPAEPRFAFQLGRAFLAAGRVEQAITQFRLAANAGHGAAWAYLGDAYQLGQGVTQSSAEAFAAYQKALGAGFSRAQTLIDQLSFDRSMYASPVVDDLFNGRHQEIRARMISGPEAERWPERAYFFALTQKLVAECGRILSPDVVPRLYNLRFGSGWTNETDARVTMTIYAAVGEYDAEGFVRRHGCEGPAAKQIFNSIVQHLRQEPGK
jgi:TPR repeat protein